jgi:hypothetical protein
MERGYRSISAKLRREDLETDVGLLAVVVEVLGDAYFIKPKGRRSNARLAGHLVWEVFGVHGLRFGDIVVVDVARNSEGRDRVTALRAVTDAEYENR